MRIQRAILAIGLSTTLVLAACGDDDNEPAATVAPTTTAAPATTTPGGTADPADVANIPVNDEAAACAADKTLAAGSLTIATGNPAFPPYVVDDAPETGEGFEANLALAVAKSMGFEGDAVKWIRTDFDVAIAPGDKDFDFNLQQYSITDERKEVVSFSEPYYTANQAVVGTVGGPADGVASLADLKGLKLGAATGTTSLQFILDVIQPTAEPFAYNSNADAKLALETGQIDAIITDLPTGLYIAAVELDNARVVGQFPVSAGGAGDTWGLLFAKDNPLVGCVNLALAALQSSGALDAIETKWMSEWSEAPELS